MGVKVQERVAPAQPASIDREAMWDRMNAHGFSQNEAARRAGISSAHLSQIMNGRNSPSAVVPRKLHGVLFQPTKAERVMPAEVKVLGWRKGERHGMVVHGAGGPGRRGRSGGPAIRVGGHMPWGAKAEFAHHAGYDGTGRVSITHVVERGGTWSAANKRSSVAALARLSNASVSGAIFSSPNSYRRAASSPTNGCSRFAPIPPAASWTTRAAAAILGPYSAGLPTRLPRPLLLRPDSSRTADFLW